MSHPRAHRSLPAVALLLAVLPALAGAQAPPPAAAAGAPAATTYKPGDPAVSGAFIRPCTNRFSIVQLKPDGTTKPVGTWTDEVKVEEMNGRAVVRRLQSSTTPSGETKYVNVVDKKTMAPIASERTTSQGLVERFDFDGTRVKYKHSATPKGGAIEDKEIHLPMPVFQFGGMYGMLLVAFPLSPGAVFRFPNLEAEAPDGMEWLSFTVKGRETVPAGPGKKVEAWVVESEQKGGVVLRFSLVKEPPYVVRLDQVVAKDGSVVRFDMI
jgi:hypothetical protein